MAKDMLTRCPHCEQAFKVSEEQLAIANGRVRCGACMSVFDATAHQLREGSTTEHVNTTSSEKISDDFSVFAPEPKEEQSVTQAKTNFGEDFSDSFLELNHPEMSFESSEQEEALEETEDDEDWAEALIEESESTPVEKPKQAKPRKEPSFSLATDADSFDFAPRASSTSSSFGHEKPISFYREDQEPPTDNSLIKTFALFFTNVILAALLALILGWFNYDKISHWPFVTDTYELICKTADCELPALVDVTKLKSNNLVVRTHPTTRNTLIIEAVLSNQANFEQDFPNLSLVFSDINNNIVAERTIEPHVYLSRDVLAWGKIPPNQPIHISLEIVDPGKTAVNYKIDFSYPNDA